MLSLPVIGNGLGFTRKVVYVEQPGRIVYNIDTVSAVTVVTRPEELIVATEVFIELQIPPPRASDNCATLPGQAWRTPVISGGGGITVTVLVERQPVGKR